MYLNFEILFVCRRYPKPECKITRCLFYNICFTKIRYYLYPTLYNVLWDFQNFRYNFKDKTSLKTLSGISSIENDIFNFNLRRSRPFQSLFFRDSRVLFIFPINLHVRQRLDPKRANAMIMTHVDR